MYVYIKTEPSLWTVGFYKPDGKFCPESDCRSEQDAAERVHWLNGGDRRERVVTEGAKPGGRTLESIELQGRLDRTRIVLVTVGVVGVMIVLVLFLCLVRVFQGQGL